MKDLQWAFSLIDRVSKNSDKISESLGRLEKQLQQTRKESMGLQNVFGGFGGPIGTVVGGLKLVAGAFLDFGSAVGSAALDVIGFKESTLVSLEAMTGSAAAAANIFDRSMIAADLTPFGSRDVVAQMKAIMGAGFDRRTAEDIFAGLADVASVSGGGAPAMQAMLVQLAQAKAIGKFQMQDLKAIMSHAGPAGVSMAALYDQLAAQTGISRAAVPTALTSGVIDADTGINALLQVIQAKVSKGALGQASMAQGKTIAGLSERIMGLPEKLLLGIDPSGTGITAIKGFLTNVLDTFDKLTGKGSRVQAFIQGLIDDFGSLFSGLAGPDGAGRMENTVSTLIDGVMEFVSAVQGGFSIAIETFKLLAGEGASMESFKATMRTMGSVVGVVANIFATFAGAIVAVATGFRDLWKLMKLEWSTGKSAFDFRFWGDKLKAALGSAVWGGVMPDARAAGVGIGQSMTEGTMQSIEAHSPSRVFQRIGAMATAGLALGVAHGAGVVDKAFDAAMVAPRATAASISAGRAVEVGGVTIQVQVDAGKDGEEIARHLTERLPYELEKLFQRLAIETGEG